MASPFSVFSPHRGTGSGTLRPVCLPDPPLLASAQGTPRADRGVGPAHPPIGAPSPTTMRSRSSSGRPSAPPAAPRRLNAGQEEEEAAHPGPLDLGEVGSRAEPPWPTLPRREGGRPASPRPASTSLRPAPAPPYPTSPLSVAPWPAPCPCLRITPLDPAARGSRSALGGGREQAGSGVGRRAW